MFRRAVLTRCVMCYDFKGSRPRCCHISKMKLMICPQCMWHMVSYGWCLSHKEKHTDKLAAYKTGRKIYLYLSITGLKFTTRNIPHLIYFSFFFPEISRGSVCLSPDTRRKSWPALSRWDSTVTTSLPLNLSNFIQWSLHSVIYLTDVKSGGRWLLLFLPSQLDGDFVLFFYNSMCCLFLLLRPRVFF